MDPAHGSLTTERPNCLSVVETPQERPSPPVNDIVPPDIWVDIFLRVYQQDLEHHQESQTNPAEIQYPRTAFIFSHVCRHWHAIVTTQPLFWNKLFVYLNAKSPHSLLMTHLERAGKTKLDISVVAPISTFLDIKELQSCFQLLHTVSKRWKSASFILGTTASNEFDKMFCQSHQAAKFSSLEFLGVASPTYTDPMERDEWLFIGRFCNRVNIQPHSLRIGGWHRGGFGLPSGSYVKSNARLQSIVSLTFVRRNFGDVQPLFNSLSMMSQLEHLELNDCSLQFRYTSLSRISLATLQRLSVLDMDHHDVVESIFDCLSLPALKDVTFTPPLNTPSFLKMALQSGCKIRRLCMTADQCFYEYLFHFLSSAPFSELEDLTLEAKELSSEQVSFLDTTEAATFSIKKLEKEVTTPVLQDTLSSLTLLGCNADDGLLGRMARSRVLHGSLRYLYVEVLNNISKSHAKDYEVFRELQRAGFDVHLRRTRYFS